MKIAIVGAGAMGSLFGALLAEGGHEVWLCDIWQDHINVLKQNGLKIEQEGKTRNVKLNAASDPRQIGESELVLIFVKSTQTRSAAESAALLAGRNGWV
ncbi:MAG: 3-hydroxyacyl-CoA dehydrogenase NAD-binding domain-containing protein, partial [Desulfobacterales bacterium]|nr:3-hydroxyacyl-CoA dehydrogenase NAD-binding domain-containing protein [Desulfobacterales bacterium]